ncbi:LacI family DNA-binding transcriptional regulator [Mesorhizobium sp. SP-1A]|uniref:LacI family DNA-binding transcriptional regulator n=1 Tax=Mesorhizobium sp. SP-1A TaxID=3077840 RepID=UPI0028F708F5|nr:LacI family DNA-binding transcriptional regulator [Mesorhizobium sp. SP-1A]
MRPTTRDVAEEAGVSLATVDRVLNRRAGVREATIARVEAAIARLGFVRDIAAANLAKQRSYRFVFVIPSGPNTFMRTLEAQAVEAGRRAALDRVEVEVVTVPPFDGTALAKVLDALDLSAVSGVALVATDSAEVREALARLHQIGIPVVTLVSDVPAFRRNHYVGIDNVAAGRTAASLIGRFLGARPGKIALIAGSMLVRDHVERRMGFDQVIRSEFPHLECLPVLEGRDDAQTTGQVLAGCLAREKDVIGLYNIGAGNRGVIEVLSGNQAGRGLTVVAHELTAHARKALRDGLFDAVIGQDAGHETRSAIRILKALIDGTPVVEGQEHIRIEIYLRDNLP